MNHRFRLRGNAVDIAADSCFFPALLICIISSWVSFCRCTGSTSLPSTLFMPSTREGNPTMPNVRCPPDVGPSAGVNWDHRAAYLTLPKIPTLRNASLAPVRPLAICPAIARCAHSSCNDCSDVLRSSSSGGRGSNRRAKRRDGLCGACEIASSRCSRQVRRRCRR